MSRYDVLNKQLCETLASIRQERGITQIRLAEQLGRVQNYISNYERGQRRLDLFELIEICHALKADPEKIVAQMHGAWRATR